LLFAVGRFDRQSAIVNRKSVVRLQKFLADAGVASRRAGEQIILEGRVAVNGHVVRLLGSKVDPDHDQVAVDGKPVRTEKTDLRRAEQAAGLRVFAQG
jgi:ribosomal protein S4